VGLQVHTSIFVAHVCSRRVEVQAMYIVTMLVIQSQYVSRLGPVGR
jgi:hypothetical protein